MTHFTHVDSPLGPMLVTARPEGIAGVFFVGQKYSPAVEADWREAPGDALLAAARREIEEYFLAGRRHFDLPLALRGTPFQVRVWHALREIPSGTTMTYGEVTARVGAPAAAARAVGAAIGRNPVSVIVPCHRVVGADGSLTGYAGGLDRKRALLGLEGGWPPQGPRR